MFYVQRDNNGDVCKVFIQETADAIEVLPAAHPDLEKFFETYEDEKMKFKLHASDFALIRVIEDLIEIMIMKNYINFTDLPPAAQSKILERKSMRDKLSGDI